MTNRGPILNELDALEVVDDLINIQQGREPDDGHVIVGALVIGIYHVDGYTKTKLSKAAIGDMNHWSQIGIHTQALQSLSRERPVE